MQKSFQWTTLQIHRFLVNACINGQQKNRFVSEAVHGNYGQLLFNKKSACCLLYQLFPVVCSIAYRHGFGNTLTSAFSDL